MLRGARVDVICLIGVRYILQSAVEERERLGAREERRVEYRPVLQLQPLRIGIFQSRRDLNVAHAERNLVASCLLSILLTRFGANQKS